MHTLGNKTAYRFKQEGFSLVELMVSLTIFSIVMTVSVGTLLVLIDANAKSQALYSAMTNLSFATDNITRNIRTGYDYYCGSLSGASDNLPTGSQDCQNDADATGIAFTREKDSVRVGYRYNPTAQSIEQLVDDNTGTDNWLRLTSDDVKVTKFEVRPSGTRGVYDTPSDSIQPRITLLIEGYVNNGLDTNTDFILQTSVTQRTLNYF